MTRSSDETGRLGRFVSPRFHAPDASGTQRALLDPNDLRHLTQTGEMARRASKADRIWGWAAVTALLLTVISCAGIPFPLGGWLTWTFFLVFFVCWATYAVLNRPRRVRDRVLSICRAGNVCASCAYTLTGIPQDSDGRVTCPECGAHWASQETPSLTESPKKDSD